MGEMRETELWAWGGVSFKGKGELFLLDLEVEW